MSNEGCALTASSYFLDLSRRSESLLPKVLDQTASTQPGNKIHSPMRADRNSGTLPHVPEASSLVARRTGGLRISERESGTTLSRRETNLVDMVTIGGFRRVYQQLLAILAITAMAISEERLNGGVRSGLAEGWLPTLRI